MTRSENDQKAVEHTPSMVKRAALALWTERENRLPGRVRRPKPDAIDMQSGAFALVVEDALAVMRAMREPTEAMVAAGNRLTLWSGTMSGCYSDHHPAPEHAWHAMISAALEQHPVEEPADRDHIAAPQSCISPPPTGRKR